MPRLLKLALLVLMAIFAAPMLLPAVAQRMPTQDGIVYGAAGGQKLTMDYYAAKGEGLHPNAAGDNGAGDCI